MSMTKPNTPNRKAVCLVCPHHCKLALGETGRCHARENRGGKVVATNYGRITSLALDPIEKKPLARFMPGSLVLSVGSYGCNLSCPFCQNFEISQARSQGVAWRDISPDDLVALACQLRDKNPQVVGIAYTYNEPLVGWEYVRDCAALAHNKGLVNVLVSNGLAEPAIINELSSYIDAANIDLKGFQPEFYRMCGGGSEALACVKNTIQQLAAETQCHLEVTTLVIPEENDSDDEIKRIAQWLSQLDCGNGTRGATELVYHITRFFPQWRMTDRPPTPVATVYHLVDVARQYLEYVYTGNC